MRRTFTTILTILTSLLIALSAAQLPAEPFRVGFYNAPPLMNQQQPDGGIFRQLLAEISHRTGLEFETRYYPSARLKRMFEQGDLDIEPGINPAWRQNSSEPGLYSVPFGVLNQIIVFHPGKQIPVNGATDLAGKLIGTIRGYNYPGYMQAFASGRIARLDVTDEPQLFELLRRRRVDQIFVDDVVYQYWRSRHSDYRQFTSGNITARVEIMLRIHPQQRSRLPILNQAISEMQADGTLERLFRPYRNGED